MARKAAGTPWVRQLLLLCGWIAGVVALSVWLVPQATAEGTWTRWASWAAVVVALVVGGWLISRPRSSRLRQR